MELTMAIPRCPLCAAERQTPYAVFPEFTWVRCGCGLIFKQGVAGALASTEMGGEGSFGESGYGQRYDRRRRHRVAKSMRQLADAREFVTDHASQGLLSVLDIGCSLGYTLEAAERGGMTPTGVDVSRTAVDACRQRGFTAEVAGLESLPFPNRSFSIVVMKHVLEHTRDPDAALREARRVLKPGGVLFIAVPNADYRKAVRDPVASRFYRPDAHGGVEHWIYYTPATLARMLGKSALQVRQVHPLRRHHRNAGLPRLVEQLAHPFRTLWSTARTRLGLRKEFWIVATRAAGENVDR